MSAIITKIAEFYPQIGIFILVLFLVGWVFYLVFGAYKNLERKIDLLGERMSHMATKEDLWQVKFELQEVKAKINQIEEKLEILWDKLIRGRHNDNYDLPLLRDE